MNDICQQYKSLTGRKVSFVIFLLLLLTGILLVALSRGASSIGFADSLAALFKDSGLAHAIVWKLSYGHYSGGRARSCRNRISGYT
jgi:hypothetical protein